jgi:hypothetical protein
MTITRMSVTGETGAGGCLPGSGRAGDGVTAMQAQAILPAVRAGIAALHNLWGICREIQRELGGAVDAGILIEALEGVIHDMADGVDDPESVDADHVRNVINAAADILEADAGPCPSCGGRFVNNVSWQDGGKAKCAACGTLYLPTGPVGGG